MALSLPVEQHEAAAAHNEEAASAESAAAKSLSVDSTQTKAPSQPGAPKTENKPVGATAPEAAGSTTPIQTSKPSTRSAGVIAPAIPALPRPSSKDTKSATPEEAQVNGQIADEGVSDATQTTTSNDNVPSTAENEAPSPCAPAPPVRAAPVSWANLFAKTSASAASKNGGANGSAAGAGVNGNASLDGSGINGSTSTFSKTNASSLAEAVQAYQVGEAEKTSFLEPRGLINTGNMCYMNSVSHISCCSTEYVLTIRRCCRYLCFAFPFMTS